MSLFTDIRDAVYTLTNRPELEAETIIGIRQAIRKAHNAGKFARDMGTALFTGLSQDQIQYINITEAPFERFQQTVLVRPTELLDMRYHPVDISDLIDNDGYGRTDVYYLIGQELNIRAGSPVDSITVVYTKRPLIPAATAVAMATLDDWICENHEDLISLWAASSVLASIGEQDIKQRIEQLAALEYADFVKANLEIERR